MRTKQKENKASGFFGHLVQIITVVILVIVALLIGSYITANGLTRETSSGSETVEIGFEDIGELVTQSAYCKEINTTNSAKNLFGFTLPFTQSTYIYSYGVEVKAGYDFSAITWSVEDTTIEVTLPEAKVLSCELDLDSFQVYYEKESAFNHITLEESNEALQTLTDKAKESAIADGLMDNARTNAETILAAFFSSAFDLDEYELKFVVL
ncbi:MAG: DUF4230 domain-containing protein [Clostridiales bacterium]|nr:DUF4230 domain-containing protein [Clostridiales bacterium]